MKVFCIFILSSLVSASALATDAFAKEFIDFMKSNLKDVRVCYKKGLKANPDLSGKIALTFEIDNMGKAQSIVVDEGQRDFIKQSQSQIVSECMLSHFKSLKYPPATSASAGKTTRVTYPFLLSRDQSKDLRD